MWRRNQQNVYVQSKRKVRIRLFTFLTLLLASLVILVVSLKPRQQLPPTNSPTTFYVDRFAEKKNYRQSVHGTLHTIELGDNLYQVLVNYGVKVREVGGLIAAWRSPAGVTKAATRRNFGTYFCTWLPTIRKGSLSEYARTGVGNHPNRAGLDNQ